jgi:hypothetical protein
MRIEDDALALKSQKTCSFKAAYSTWDRAEDQAIQMSIKTGESIVTYECSECSRFHIGHADKAADKSRKIREAALSLNTLCPRCDKPVSDERRFASARSGRSLVYCSRWCRRKSAIKRRNVNRHVSKSEVK